MQHRLLASLLMAATALGGCTLTPPYERPLAPVAQAWPAGTASATAESGPLASSLAWREVFVDPRLQGLIDLALVQNRDLRVAVGNIQRARAQYRVQRAELIPGVALSASQARSRTPQDVAGFSAPGSAGGALDLDSYSVNLGVSAYELDLFGRVRSLSNAGLETFFAAEENRRAAQISLISEVAGAYLALAADQDLLGVTQDTLKARQAAYDINRKRFDAGAVSQLDLDQTQTLVEQARSDAAAAAAQVTQDLNALRLVVGAEPPASLLPRGDVAGVAILADLRPGLPSDVLTQRPDVMAAEHALKAQNANIGAARAAFFPRISLTGSLGASSTSLDGLFSAGTGAWSFAPQITLPIFGMAANAANLSGARAGRDIAVAQYEKAIQVAFREVADALAVRATLRKRGDAQERLAAAALNAQRLTQARYDSGIDSYLALLDAQRTAYAAQQSLIATRRLAAANRVELYRALGGGA